MTTPTLSQVQSNENVLGAVLIAHLKEYIQLFMQDSFDLQQIDINDLTQKITNLNNVLDGDNTSEGFQIFMQLQQAVQNLQSSDAAQAAAITNLQSALATATADLTARINQVESDAQAARDAINARVSTLENQHTAFVQATLAKDNTQDTTLANHETRITALEASQATQDGKISALEASDTQQAAKIAALETAQGNLENALTAESNRAQAAEQNLQTQVTNNTSRIDALQATAGDFVTRTGADSLFVAFVAGGITELWKGRTQPAGLPQPNAVV